ncbi:MAG: amidase domain-containing protein [Clostridia bacterium]|nr:amidase domain-containing protein [Clostridia bacterium]
MQLFSYQPVAGGAYAQGYANSALVPPELRLFYVDANDDCTNFISQCVWAGYGGWLPGFTSETVSGNLARIAGRVRQSALWFGSHSYIGSNRWCRVEEFYHYCTDTTKSTGPRAAKIAEGPLGGLDASLIAPGDVIQLVVTSYTPDRYGHGLYVTQAGGTLDDTLICSHTLDRLDEPLSWFAQYPDVYSRARVLRFEPASFEK